MRLTLDFRGPLTVTFSRLTRLFTAKGANKKGGTYYPIMATESLAVSSPGVPIDANTVADGVILEMVRQKKSVDNLKLNKLLFYVDNVYYVLVKKQLIRDNFEAWVHGPVVPSVYRRFKSFGWQYFGSEVVHSNGPEDPDIREAIAQVVDQLGHFDGSELERRSHRVPTYIEARAGLAPDAISTAVIDRDKTHAYFAELLAA